MEMKKDACKLQINPSKLINYLKIVNQYTMQVHEDKRGCAAHNRTMSSPNTVEIETSVLNFQKHGVSEKQK